MNERGSTVEKTNDKLNETQKSIIEIISKIENHQVLQYIYIIITDIINEEK